MGEAREGELKERLCDVSTSQPSLGKGVFPSRGCLSQWLSSSYKCGMTHYSCVCLWWFWVLGEGTNLPERLGSREDKTRTAFAYAIDKLQDRGRFFIFPQEDVYAGQVVGENAKDNDIVVNVTKSKKLTNMRASGADDKARIIPPVVFSLEEALEYIKADEYVEVTPNHIRMRKIILDEIERKRANKE